MLSHAVKVREIDGNRALLALKKAALLNRHLSVRNEGEYLLLPIETILDSEQRLELGTQLNFEFVEADFALKPRIKTLQSALSKKIPRDLVEFVPRSMDALGHVAVLEIPEVLAPHAREIGSALLEVHRNIKTVLAKAGPISGTYRTRRFRLIAGSDDTETVHKENGCVFKLNVKQVYFSPRLAHERLHVSNQVVRGEVVTDLFAGVGPFSILIAKRHASVKVNSIDSNRHAFGYMNQNIQINKVKDRVTAFHGNASIIVKKHLAKSSDRAIMNLPERSTDFVHTACEALKPVGGKVHFYSFQSEPQPEANAKELFIRKVSECGRVVQDITNSRKVKAYGPRQWLIGLDAQVV